jgi:maltose O-acetyltransferase
LFTQCGINVNVEAGAYIGCGRDISIGDYSGIGINAWIGSGTTIGAHVMMGPDVMVFNRNHQASRCDIPMSEQGMASYMPVTIEDDVWIGARAILLPGVTVHSHSIVGAGSVVTKDVPSWVVVAGNPARVLRDRKALSSRESSGQQ